VRPNEWIATHRRRCRHLPSASLQEAKDRLWPVVDAKEKVAGVVLPAIFVKASSEIKDAADVAARIGPDG
jgi:hypothetical protein